MFLAKRLHLQSRLFINRPGLSSCNILQFVETAGGSLRCKSLLTSFFRAISGTRGFLDQIAVVYEWLYGLLHGSLLEQMKERQARHVRGGVPSWGHKRSKWGS